MRRALAILFLLLTLAACASQRLPATQGVPTLGPTPVPAPPAPANGLIVYARSVAPGRPYEPLLSDLVVVDELGREQRTLPITNVIDGFATRAPNKAIYRTTEGYFLADAALGTIQSLPMTQPAPLIPLVPRQIGASQILMEERYGGGVSISSRVHYLVDLEHGGVVELNALLNFPDNARLNPMLSPDEQYVLAHIHPTGLALIPTADPASWRMLATSDVIFGASWAADSRSVIYTGGNGQVIGLRRISVNGGPPELLANGRVNPWSKLHDPTKIMLSDAQGLIILDLASGKQRHIEQCAGNSQIVMSDTDDRFLCTTDYSKGWQFIDLSAGSVTGLPELASSMPYSLGYQRWAVFGTPLGGYEIAPMPTRIVDLHTGRIVARMDDNAIIDVAPDGSAALVESNIAYPDTLWLVNRDGTHQLIDNRALGAGASFSPDGQFILSTNTVYDADATPVPAPISLLDRSGKLIRTLEIPGIYPIWLEQ
jgi:hypothetical protein